MLAKWAKDQSLDWISSVVKTDELKSVTEQEAVEMELNRFQVIACQRTTLW